MNTRKKVAFLLSGQWPPRGHRGPLSSAGEQIITQSYSDKIFTKKFKKKYDYKIFISTDDLHLKNTFNYLNREHIGNIHLNDTGYYYKQIKKNIPSVGYYLSRYDPPSPYWKYESSIQQYYKVYDALNLLLNEEDHQGYDYIIRMRLDIKFVGKELTSYLEKLSDEPKLEALMYHDFFAAGKPEIMKVYCGALSNKYGTHNFDADLSGVESPDIWHNTSLPYKNFKKLPQDNRFRLKWTYAPEVQLFEELFAYCNEKGKNINETMEPIPWGEIAIVR